MFSLRVFQNKHNEQTNTHVTTFDDRHCVSIQHDPDLAHVDWESCVFQIYPTQTEKHTFYTLPAQHALFLFNVAEGNVELLGQTRAHDEYIYFKPTKRPRYTFRLVVAETVDKAKELLVV